MIEGRKAMDTSTIAELRPAFAEGLADIRHQSRNDMQMVIGMLAMQARCASNAEARAALETARERVAVLARRHADDAPTAAAVVRQVCDGIGGAAARRGIALQVQALDATPLRPQVATSLGLIVNELASNAVKHAFGDAGGALTIRVERDGDRVQMTVDDDGAPMPVEPRPGLGLELVRRLVKSLRGEMRMPGGGSKAFVVRVPAG